MIAIGKLKEYSGYIEALEKKIDCQKNIVNNARENVDIVKSRLIEAKREREIFEKLKQKKFESYLIEEERQEQKIVDEVISYKQTIRNTKDGR